MGTNSIELAVTTCHRARVSVRRLLRADEVAVLLRDLLSAMRAPERERIVLGEWGDVLLETTARANQGIDLRGLGALAYRMLTGQNPTTTTRYVPGAPPLLSSLILRLMSSDTRVRPSVKDAESALGAMLGTPSASDSQRFARGTGELGNKGAVLELADNGFDVVDSWDELD